MSEFETRLEYIKSNVGITSIYPLASEQGSSICPCCNKKGKFYVSRNMHFRCFSTSCELNSYRLGKDVVALYRWFNGLTSKAGFWKALEELELGYGLGSYSSSRDKRSDVLDKALSIYQYYLWSDYGKEALRYLESRGFDREAIKLAGIGYAPSSGCLRSYDINAKDFKNEYLISQDDVEYYSKRIIFPIRDTENNLVHFTGRYLGEVPKDNEGSDLLSRYKDTKARDGMPNSKNYLAFGEHASDYAKDVFLVEGYPDAFSLYQYGVPVFGMLGLEKLSVHAPLLSRFDIVTCVFDNDRYANDHPQYPMQYKSWRRIIPQLVDLQIILPNVRFKILTMPEGQGKDINDWFGAGNSINDFLGLESRELVKYLIHNWGSDISNHIDLIKLVSLTGIGKEELSKYIPQDIGVLDYAIRLFR